MKTTMKIKVNQRYMATVLKHRSYTAIRINGPGSLYLVKIRRNIVLQCTKQAPLSYNQGIPVYYHLVSIC